MYQVYLEVAKIEMESTKNNFTNYLVVYDVKSYCVKSKYNLTWFDLKSHAFREVTGVCFCK